MRCSICGKFMEWEHSYDLLDYYRCIDDCSREVLPDLKSEEKTIRWLDKVRGFKLEDKMVRGRE